jgi:membrane-bound inhibitor of C-type lysozyme
MRLKKYIFSVFVIVSMMLAACASSKGTYVCSDGNRFQVTIAENGEKAVLRLGERLLELPHVRSASGAKYSDGMTTFWSKGNQAFIATNGKVSHRDCTLEK